MTLQGGMKLKNVIPARLGTTPSQGVTERGLRIGEIMEREDLTQERTEEETATIEREIAHQEIEVQEEVIATR